ncbi:MAG TPA: LysR substrate-binding domain-containing protein [Ktedonobacteraceae bacterium]|nr:LysR substrate-binding domain-containing protein [Ktedonobacteraceae bacterium]
MDNVIDLRRLYYFMIVAQELHFTRAAERLHIAQPPLSYQIQQLERELGVQLFERTRHSVQLTEAGHVLLGEARRIFGQMEQTVRMVQRVGHGEVGLLTLGFVPSASNNILPLSLREFHQRFPNVQLFLKELNPDQLVHGLHERHIDVGFLFLPLDDKELTTRPVLSEPLLAVLPVTHPLATQPVVSLQSFADDPFIIPPRYALVPGLRSHILEACRRAGFIPKVAQEAWLMQTIIGLVAADMGVALVPASVQNLHRTGIVYKPLQDSLAQVQMGVIWRHDETLPTLQRFLQVIDGMSLPGQ